jgi:hypothetical protein
MKKYTLIIAAFFATGAILSGCKKDFLSLEVNPNTPSVITPDFALAGAEKVAADIVNTNYTVQGVWGGYWTTSGNYVPSPAIQQYQFTTDNFQVFTGLYQNATNFDNLEKLGAASPSLAGYQAIAKIMKAYDFQQLVDVYNDVPYTQAFNASQYLFPKYDKGKDIYDDLAKQLVAAIGIINANASATVTPASDIIFAGDMTKWKKFANTLLLRLAIRQSKLDGGTAKGLLASVAGEGYIDGTFYAKANPGYTGAGAEGQQSPFWRSFGKDISGNVTGNNLYYRANQFAVDLLNEYNDPRVRAFYLTFPGDLPGKVPTVKGIIFGDPNAPANAGSSAIGNGLLKAANMDANLLSSAESLFLQAEAVQRTWISGNAKALYEAGVRASFAITGAIGVKTPYIPAVPEDKTTTPVTPEIPAVPATYYDTPDASATAYLAQAKQNVSWDASTDKLQAIAVQKWISLNGYANLEGFSEFKRTGYPAVPRSIDSKAIGSGIPNRIYYPTSEYQQNGDAVGAAGTIDPFTSKIFWE